MSKRKTLIGSLELQREGPTECTFADLHDWVLWQFPLLKGGWLSGAAHPAQPAHGWIPARIQPLKKRVLLYAHCGEPLASPEEAARWIVEQHDG